MNEKKSTNSDQATDSELVKTEKNQWFSIPFAILIALTLLSGVVHGVIDGRWTSSEDLIARGEKLNDAPEKCGKWELIEVKELDENASELLQCYAQTVRVYKHVELDSIVTVAVLFGPRGPIAVHTPEVCYSSVGTKQVGTRRVESIQGTEHDHTLWSVQFSKSPSPQPALDVWYAWSDGTAWHAADYPRFWMVDSLYKIQIAGPVGNSSFRPCKDFLASYLPKIEKLIAN